MFPKQPGLISKQTINLLQEAHDKKDVKGTNTYSRVPIVPPTGRLDSHLQTTANFLKANLWSDRVHFGN